MIQRAGKQLGYRFPPGLRLRHRTEFIRCREMGRKIHTSHFLVYALKKTDGPSRIGITASRRVGNAVVRNRVKRLVREFFRNRRHQLPQGYDYSVIAKSGAGSLNQEAVNRQLSVMERVGPRSDSVEDESGSCAR